MGYQNDAAAAYDYNYENQDYVEEPQPSLIPQFTTEAKHFKVAKDRILRLPCHVDQLGKPKGILDIFFQFTILLTLFCDTKIRNMNYYLRGAQDKPVYEITVFENANSSLIL